MPKTGLSSSQWRQRLHLFAQGKFDFGRGHRPRKGSDRARELERIEKCPKHRNSVLVDPFGRRTQCNCGYHQPQVSEILKMKYCIINNNNTLCSHFSHIAATIPIQPTTSLSASPGSQVGISSSSSSVPSSDHSATIDSTVSTIDNSATAESSQTTCATAQIQVSYTTFLIRCLLVYTMYELTFTVYVAILPIISPRISDHRPPLLSLSWF